MARQNVRPEETASGFSADIAWQTIIGGRPTIGDRRVLIAVLDSGIRWNSPDLVNKFYLNRGELPPPDAGCGNPMTRTDQWDSNGDGIFNIQDYARPAPGDPTHLPVTPCDSRVHDTNGNGFIDPQDLISIFSDRRDDDGNGYVDDISGWDMYQDDNDPNDDTDYGHGTGESRDSAAEGNNQRDSLGVCPECTVMMVRTGDSFVVDADDFAMAVLYAVDRGANVIQEALGSVDNSSLTQAAIDYAYAENVTLIASAADEDSFHHNFPGSNQHTAYVHAIRYDSNDWQTARTYLNFNNCTNYGGQLVLSTPGTGCSSEATGRTAGMAGLLYAAALQAGIPLPRATESDPQGHRRLSAEEVKQLLITTVDDINIPDYDPATQYPSQPGWDQRFGYGRPNIGRAVRQVAAGKIPPEVDIDRPYWFEVVYPDKQPMLPITAHIRVRSDRYQSYDWTLEYATGIEPPDSGSAWHTIDSKTGVVDPVGTTLPLATWNISSLTVDNPTMPEPDRDVNKHMVTLRLRVTAHSSTVGDVQGVMRKTFHIFRDPGLLPGYPIYLGASGESSPKLADLDGDRKRELIVADADGRVHAFDASGHEKPGWPFHVSTLRHIPNHMAQRAFASGAVDRMASAPILATPAIGDLDGDGVPEVVVATRGGEVWALHKDGTPVAGFPVQINRELRPMADPKHLVDVGIFSSPVLYDLDGDKKPEIIFGAFDGKLYVYHGNGQPADGFPVELRDLSVTPGENDVALQRVMATAAVGDIDKDGKPDIVIASTEHYSGNGRIYAVYADGNRHAGGPFLPNWPIKSLTSADVLPVVGNGIPNSTAMADVDGDGFPEVAAVPIVGVPKVYRGTDPRFPAFSMQNSNFGPQADATDLPTIVLIANLTFGDIDNDGQVDLIAPTAGFKAANAFATGGTRSDFQHEVAAWNAKTGEFLPAFPRRIDDWQFFGNADVADVDGDGLPEVIEGSAGYYLHAWNKNGKEPAGWPKFTGGWIIETAALGDMDGDGKLEVAVGTRNGWLFAWHTGGRENGRIDWASFHHDNANTGNLMTRLDFAPAPGSGDQGCGCRVGAAGSAGGGPSSVLLLLAYLFFVKKSRRERRDRSVTPLWSPRPLRRVSSSQRRHAHP